ncbi:MAG: c-type cytochrome [Myxococcota bacterium]
MSRGAGLAAGILLLAVGSSLPACDSRSRDARAALSPAEQALFDRGAQATVECWSCHDFYSDETRIGPGLQGVMGRRAGAVDGFAYSEALRSSGIVWSPGTLSAYLASPQTAVPGTTMVWRGVGDPGTLRAMVFWIEAITRPPAP